MADVNIAIDDVKMIGPLVADKDGDMFRATRSYVCMNDGSEVALMKKRQSKKELLWADVPQSIRNSFIAVNNYLEEQAKSETGLT